MILCTPNVLMEKNPKEIQFYFILNQSSNATKKNCIITCIVNNHQSKMYAAFLYPQKREIKPLLFILDFPFIIGGLSDVPCEERFVFPFVRRLRCYRKRLKIKRPLANYTEFRASFRSKMEEETRASFRSQTKYAPGNQSMSRTGKPKGSG